MKIKMIHRRKHSVIYGMLLVLFLTITSSSAQVSGIGMQDPNASTALEVSSNLRAGGVLLPRVQLINNLDVTTVPSPTSGLIVYNLGNSGNGNTRVEANRIYFWNGTRWTDLADRQLVRRLLLPPVFFAQCEGDATNVSISGSNLTNLNNGGVGYVVPFPTNSVVVNNFDNITLNGNNIFRINNGGTYEVSAFINYSPGIANGYDNEDTYNDYNNARTSLEFRIQQSTNGVSWTTVATSRSIWSLLTGAFFRNVTLPPVIIQGLQQGDLLRMVIARPDSYGGAHGGSNGSAAISVGEGTVITRNIRMLKIE